MQNLIFFLLFIVIIFIIFMRIIAKRNIKNLATKAMIGVDVVKLYLYRLFKNRLSSKYDETSAGQIAGAMVNEVFNNHPEMTLQFYNQNKELIDIELIAFGNSITNEFRQFLTDTLRIFWISLYAKQQEMTQQDIFNCVEKNYERNLFNKGGEEPDINNFFEHIKQINTLNVNNILNEEIVYRAEIK